MGLPSSVHGRLLRIAAEVLRETLAGRSCGAGENLEPALLQPAGSFVSLHDKNTHRLRGCIGSFDTSRPMVESILATARSVLDDPRFVDFPVTLMELPELEIEISILSPLKPAENVLDFDLLNEGIYLTVLGRSGCFLPQVARETGWDREQLLSRLCTEKLGVPAIAWKSPLAKLQTFEVVVVGPSALSEIFQKTIDDKAVG